MPAAVAIPLITAGVSAGATAYGAHEAASANEDASQRQAASAAQALADARAQRAWQQQQYVNTLRRLAPYTTAGNQSLGIASALLRRSPFASGISLPNYTPPQSYVMPNSPTAPPPASSSGGGLPGWALPALSIGGGATLAAILARNSGGWKPPGDPSQPSYMQPPAAPAPSAPSFGEPGLDY
jgi:hypothetical protein